MPRFSKYDVNDVSYATSLWNRVGSWKTIKHTGSKCCSLLHKIDVDDADKILLQKHERKNSCIYGMGKNMQIRHK